MLYIIYGLVSTVGEEMRNYLEGLGISKIDKITYKTEKAYVQPSVGALNLVSDEDEIKKCDYIYEIHGRLVGFTSEQIEKAVNGFCDSYLTFSSGNLSFLEEIKNAYGNHVSIIYTYIEDKALKTIVDSINTSEDQKLARINMGAEIKKSFLLNRELFDETVIYSGEDTFFNLSNLRHQFKYIVDKYKNAENELIPLPYTGNKPYIFVSYARDDTDKVLPILKLLQRNGCRIWYDKGIRGGDNWMTTLAMKIKGCSQYILFSSQKSTQSLWTKREIRRALSFPSLSIVTVRMDDFKFEEGIEWPLGDYQQLFLNADDFEEKLLDSIDDDVIEKIN